MPQKTNREGYLLVDHSACPDFRPGALPTQFESATITCSHCQRVVVLNPDRTRSRGYCRKCDHYVCDECELERVQSGGACLTFNQIIEDHQNQQEKAPRYG